MLRSSFSWVAAAAGVLVIFAGGCHSNKQPAAADFKTPINDYYSAHPDCIWPSPTKFPAQADASNDAQTQEFDALTDAGLLTRTPQEKKRFLIGSKQVNDYDISDKGRAVWTPDQSQPGYGNFCFGHREVTSVDSFTTAANQNAATTATVNYHYDITGVADWAKLSEMQTAFPTLQSDLAGQRAATAKLTQTQGGWQYSGG